MDPHAVRPLTTPARPHRGATITAGPAFADDLDRARSLGLDRIRLDVPWARAEPRRGAIDGGVFETILTDATAARAAGIDPWLRIAPPEVPRWFDDDGGFTDRRTAGRTWPRWVETVAERLGDVAAGWVPFEAPFGIATRLAPDDPRRQGEVLDTLVVAWRDAWRLLRGGPPVSTSLDVATERPTDETPDAVAEARRRERCRWDVWLDGLRDGVVRIPGRAERHLDDLAGSCDVLGLAVTVDATGAVSGRPPGGIESLLHRVVDRGPDRPVALTVRVAADGDDERAEAIGITWRAVLGAADSLPITSVTTVGLAGWDA